MKKLRNTIILLMTLFLNASVFSQVGFTENKGQIYDQYYKSNPNVQFLFDNGSLHVQLTKQGFSYEIFDRFKGSDIESKQLKFRRIDIYFDSATKGSWVAFCN